MTDDPILFDDQPRLTIQALMDQTAVLHRQTVRGERKSRWFNASKLGFCLYRQVLERAGVPPTEGAISSRTMRKFAWGDLLQNYVTTRVKHMGLYIASEVGLRDEEYGVSGYLDLVWGGEVQPVPEEFAETYSPEWIAYLEACRDWVKTRFGDRLPVQAVEIKSMGISTDRLSKEGPPDHHFYQLGWYAWASARHPEVWAERGLPVPEEWRLVEIGRQSAGIVEFGLTAAWMRRVQIRVEQLRYYWEYPEDAPCECKESAAFEKEWRYCAYIDPEDLDRRWKKDVAKEDIRCCDRRLLEQALRLREEQVTASDATSSEPSSASGAVDLTSTASYVGRSSTADTPRPS